MSGIGRPMAMGAGMGLMMLWMVHGMMTGDANLGGWALVGFIGVHLVLVVVVGAAGYFASRLSPRARVVVARLHRPNLRHLAVMVAGAFGAVIVAHLSLHGGIV